MELSNGLIDLPQSSYLHSSPSPSLLPCQNLLPIALSSHQGSSSAWSCPNRGCQDSGAHNAQVRDPSTTRYVLLPPSSSHPHQLIGQAPGCNVRSLLPRCLHLPCERAWSGCAPGLHLRSFPAYMPVEHMAGASATRLKSAGETSSIGDSRVCTTSCGECAWGLELQHRHGAPEMAWSSNRNQRGRRSGSKRTRKTVDKPS